MTHGFILTRQWHERPSGDELVFWVTTGEGSRKLVFRGEESVFFVESRDFEEVARLIRREVEWRHAALELRSFDRQPVTACYFRCRREMNLARARLEQHRIVVFEADVRPTDRFLMERFIQGGVEFSDRLESDTTLVDPSVRASDWKPRLRVVSLDIETSWDEHVLYSIAIHGDCDDTVFMIGEPDVAAPAYLKFVDDERSLLEAFLEWFSLVDPDIIIGWSVVGFDLRFLQQRCDAHNMRFVIGRGQETPSWREQSDRQSRLFVVVPGRVVLDGIEMLRAATWSFESFSLENVAQELLGRGKLVHDVDARAEEIKTMFRTDKLSLARYNLEDCVLVREIFDHADLIEFAVQRSAMTGLELDRSGGSVAAFDFLYLPRLHRKGYVGPVLDANAVAGSPGGYVLDSKPGIYDNVIVLDFKSLYPSIIRTFNVDPLALVEGLNEPNAIPGFVGGQFSRTKAILPTIIENLWARRDEAKRAGNAPLSQAIKILMNSFYGVLGTTGCRFFDGRLVSSITMRGHEILQTTRDLIEAQGFPVIYGDTDSVFVLVEDRAGDITVAQAGERLSDDLNRWWREHLRDTLDIESCLEVEFETHFRKFFMPTVRGSDAGSKKRYAGMVADETGDRMVFKGLETVRSDWSRLAREFQQELYRRVFQGESVDDLIEATVAAVRDGKRDEQLVLRKRLRRQLHEYERNVPPHVRAARTAEKTRAEKGLPPRYTRGSWVEYVMTVNGPEAVSSQLSPPDYDFYVDRQLAPVADAVLQFEGRSLASITDRQLGLF